MSPASIPHGGELVDLFSEAPEEWPPYFRLRLSPRQQADFELLATGAMSPLRGFMVEADYHRVLEHMQLGSGRAWTLPITLRVDNEVAARARADGFVHLTGREDRILGLLRVASVFNGPRRAEALSVFGTRDRAHPGVAELLGQPATCIGGTLRAYRLPVHRFALSHRYTPAELRAEFQRRGWQSVVGFQTRNPIHRAHEYITKCAQELVDGLLLHPIVGSTIKDDTPAAVRMDCYAAMLENYYRPERTMLAVFPAAMRYAGPREAVFHALVRKNYGCTHFIVGRDHAGIGDYYRPYEAQRIFDQFDPVELGIMVMRFENAFYCLRTGGMATSRTSPSEPAEQINLSGTEIRKLLKAGKELPPEFTRPEVARILSQGYE